MKAQLVASHRERMARIESGDLKVIGQNCFTETEDSPLTAGADGGILTPDPEVERECREALERWRAERDEAAVKKALENLAAAAADESANIMPATIEAAKAGATTGEWAGVLRDAFGDYRGPTGVGAAAPSGDGELMAAARERVEQVSEEIGHRIRILVAKPGLDGHSNGAEQIAVRARDVGMEVIYQGIRLTPAEIAESALQEDVDVVGLSILSGSHRELVPETVRLMREQGVDAPVIVGGIIPASDEPYLTEAGVARIYTPKDFDLNRIMGEIADLVAERARDAAAAGSPLERGTDRVPDRRDRRRRHPPPAPLGRRYHRHRRGCRTRGIQRYTTVPSAYAEPRRRLVRQARASSRLGACAD